MTKRKPRPDQLRYKILDALWNAAIMLPDPLESPYRWKSRLTYFDPDARSSYFAIRDLKRRRAIRVVEKRGKKFIQLTKKGELEVLLARSRMSGPVEKWDNKWRVIIYDIPQNAYRARNRFRELLYEAGFQKLQHSVFVSPHPLNQAAVDYLRESNLLEFVRILRVDKLDSDVDLRKRFSL